MKRTASTARFCRWLIAFCGLVMLVGIPRAEAAESLSQAEKERFFESQVRPLLARNCFECHGPKKQQAGLRLDSRESLLKGNESGPVVVPGHPEKSRLVEAINYPREGIQMPPPGKLSGEAIQTLTAWVKMGAPWLASDKPTAAGAESGLDLTNIETALEHHWAFQPIERPEVPQVKNGERVKNPVDAFVISKLEEQGMSLSAPADRRTLIRRATFDLLGVPPTFEEVEAFRNDQSPNAFAKVVDRLLDSPKYGQRWGRHWLDVARYADSKGYVFTAETRYPFAYTYRDYVIRAFNEDLPYNRFILEQLAADQLDLGDDKRALAALGFLTVGRRFRNNNHDIIDDRIDVVGRGLMGLTISCARCHDHKYDPIPTKDYYSLYGVFASSYEPDLGPKLGEPEKTPAYEKYRKELEKREKALEDHIQTTRREMMKEFRTRVTDYLLVVAKEAPSAKSAEKISFDHDEEPRDGMVRRWKNYLKQQKNKKDSVFAAWHALYGVPKEKFLQRVSEWIEQQGSEKTGKKKASGSQVNRLVLETIQAKKPKSMLDVARVYGKLLSDVHQQWKELKKSEKASSSLPRPAAEQLRQVLYAEDSPTTLTVDEAKRLFTRLARNKERKLRRKVDQLRVTSPAAPARAMVLYNKDRPVTPRVFERGNSGRRGEKVPRRFPQVLSAAAGLPEKFEEGSGRLELARAIVDRENPLTARVLVNRLWMHHFGEGLVTTPSDFGVRSNPPSHPKLLDYLATTFMDEGWSLKELHRKIMLSATYRQASEDRPECREKDPENRFLWKQNRHRLEFEPMRDALLSVAGRLDATVGGRPVKLEERPFPKRRTVYGFVNRNNLPSLFRIFDFASPDASSPKRPETTVPQQALYQMNSPFVIEQARHLAAHEDVASHSNPADKIDALYRRVYARRPSLEEIKMGLNFIESQKSSQKETKDDMSPWEKYAQVLLLTNEFLFVD